MRTGADEEVATMVWAAVVVGVLLVGACSATVLRKWGRRRG
ncbi:hypothetical protein KPATCC21470_3193 [Kitasatospora purpeofusca]